MSLGILGWSLCRQIKLSGPEPAPSRMGFLTYTGPTIYLMKMSSKYKSNNMSCVMRKPDFCIVVTTQLISAFIFAK